MGTETSNIDDLLMAGNSPSIPPTSESEPYKSPETEDYSYGEIESPGEDSTQLEEPIDNNDRNESEDIQENNPEHDDYGNVKPKSRTYTEEEHREILNREIRRRGREKKEQLEQPQVQQPNISDSDEGWKYELENFVEQTFSKMTQKQIQQQQMQREKEINEQFQDKFRQGMERFNDFTEVVGSQPVTDHMTYALRGLPDPTAFIYAASKNHSKELARISQIPDPIAQIMEMGRLEERMRKSSPGTKAPKPVSRSRDDGNIPVTTKRKEPTIEDLIAQSDAKRQAMLNSKRRR